MKQKWTVFIGTFADRFFSMTFDTETLEAENLHAIHNPAGKSAFFALSSDSKYLYAANEFQSGAGSVAAFRLTAGQEPRFLNAVETGSQGPAHISMINCFGRDYLLGSGYFDGDIMVWPLSEDGHLMPMSENFRLRDGAHAHGIRPIPGTGFVLTTDTEHGLIYTYELTPEGKLIKRHCYSEQGLEAPRHMTFSKDGGRVFVVTERTATLEVFTINRENGELSHTNHFNNLPDDFTGESSSAAIHISPDGQYVYCSNRGHDSLTVYRVENEKITKVGCVSESIRWPREFLIDPEGTCLLVGNQLDESVSVFRINRTNGMPEFSGKKISLSEGPACFACI